MLNKIYLLLANGWQGYHEFSITGFLFIVYQCGRSNNKSKMIDQF